MPPLLDDRGRRARAFPALSIVAPAALVPGLSAEAKERIAARLAVWALREDTAEGLAFIGMTVGCTCVGLLMATVPLPTPVRFLAIPGAIGAFVLGVVRYPVWRLRRRYGRVLAAALVAEARCGSCAYDLTGSAIEADGCTVCPECGAAWRMSAGPGAASPAA